MKPIRQKHGSISITIRRVKNGQYFSYRCVGRLNGRAVMVSRSNLEEAKLAAKQLAEEIANGQADKPIVRPNADVLKQAELIERAEKLLKKPIAVILAEYGDMVHKLQDVPPMTAVQFYLRRHPAQLNEMKPKPICHGVLAHRELILTHERLNQTWYRALRDRNNSIPI